MNWRKFVLGPLMALAMACGLLVTDIPGGGEQAQAQHIQASAPAPSIRARAADLAASPGAPPAAPSHEADWVATPLDGTRIKRVRIEPAGDRFVVVAELDAEGARRLTALSRRLVGKPLAIFVGDRLVAASVVERPLEAGQLRLLAWRSPTPNPSPEL